MKRTRVLLADDDGPTMSLWRALLESEFDIVGAVTNGEALIDEADRLGPDVIVTDVVMPGVNGLTAARQILHSHPAARVVLVTVHADHALLRCGIAAGAFGYVLKMKAGEDLIPAIRAAHRGELFISAFARGRVTGWA
jgi:DNA-binding NarL/FixJ family response regulator